MNSQETTGSLVLSPAPRSVLGVFIEEHTCDLHCKMLLKPSAEEIVPLSLLEFLFPCSALIRGF